MSLDNPLSKQRLGRFFKQISSAKLTESRFFAILKRGLYGVFHNVSKRHLHRYLAEFAFR
ncbi:MAG: transposase, partial [Phycisphaerae bacterium]|nr:transposase [Phycisphaerae bacterium]